MLARKHRDDWCCRKTQISDINQSVTRLQVQIKDLRGQRASLEAAVTGAEQCGELALEDVQVKVTELGAALRTTKQVPGIHEYQAGLGSDDHLLLTAGGLGELAGVWDATYGYLYQDHQRLLRWAEPSLQKPQAMASTAA